MGTDMHGGTHSAYGHLDVDISASGERLPRLTIGVSPGVREVFLVYSQRQGLLKAKFKKMLRKPDRVKEQPSSYNNVCFVELDWVRDRSGGGLLVGRSVVSQNRRVNPYINIRWW